jgi:hypothetical protein
MTNLSDPANQRFATPLAAWLLVAFAASQVACWSASLCDSLDKPLFVWMFLLLYMILLGLLTGLPRKISIACVFHTSWRRFKRPLPAAFFLVALMTTLGALLYHPSNYDHLSYRFPRLLHWWSEGHWHWIATDNGRMNYSGIAFEWTWYPWFLLFRSDWPAVALNLGAFMLLPGQTFRFLRFLGVGGRLSSIWMWVWPAGYGYVAQAGSAGNDGIGAFLFLLAFNFACESRHGSRFFNSCLLASGLLTGLKLSNMPLLLPIAVILLCQFRTITKQLVSPSVLAAAAIAIVTSAVPICAMNFRHSGSWTGDPHNSDRLKVQSPLAGLAGNSLQLTLGVISPPVNPAAAAWNSRWPQLLQGEFGKWLEKEYPRFRLTVREVLGEEDAGLGIGLLVALGATLCWTSRISRRFAHPDTRLIHFPRFAILFSAWIAAIVFASKLGSESIARLALPYYPLLIGVLLRSRSIHDVRRSRWLTKVGALAILSSVPMLVLWPARPLFPWQQVARLFPENSTVQERFKTVYETYAQRWNAFGPLVEQLPPGTRELGFITRGDDPETSLWRPFGTRRVIHLPVKESRVPMTPWPPAEDLPEIAVAEETLLRSDAARSALVKTRFEPPAYLGGVTLTLKAQHPDTHWNLIQLRPLNGSGDGSESILPARQIPQNKAH